MDIGIFVFRASRYLEELEKFDPDILNACQDGFADKLDNKIDSALHVQTIWAKKGALDINCNSITESLNSD
ncbi:MAG: hypothetical protein JKY41_03445 [Rhodobacteraceae bacterium]|nr:hypothetical protein [Paracoccaceae bacterium]